MQHYHENLFNNNNNSGNNTMMNTTTSMNSSGGNNTNGSMIGIQPYVQSSPVAMSHPIPSYHQQLQQTSTSYSASTVIGNNTLSQQHQQPQQLLPQQYSILLQQQQQRMSPTTPMMTTSNYYQNVPTRTRTESLPEEYLRLRPHKRNSTSSEVQSLSPLTTSGTNGNGTPTSSKQKTVRPRGKRDVFWKAFNGSPASPTTATSNTTPSSGTTTPTTTVTSTTPPPTANSRYSPPNDSPKLSISLSRFPRFPSSTRSCPTTPMESPMSSPIASPISSPRHHPYSNRDLNSVTPSYTSDYAALSTLENVTFNMQQLNMEKLQSLLEDRKKSKKMKASASNLNNSSTIIQSHSVPVSPRKLEPDIPVRTRSRSNTPTLSTGKKHQAGILDALHSSTTPTTTTAQQSYNLFAMNLNSTNSDPTMNGNALYTDITQHGWDQLSPLSAMHQQQQEQQQTQTTSIFTAVDDEMQHHFESGGDDSTDFDLYHSMDDDDTLVSMKKDNNFFDLDDNYSGGSSSASVDHTTTSSFNLMDDNYNMMMDDHDIEHLLTSDAPKSASLISEDMEDTCSTTTIFHEYI